MKIIITLLAIALIITSLGVAVYYMQDKSTDNISELKATTSEYLGVGLIGGNYLFVVLMAIITATVIFIVLNALNKTN